jgi:hypothetical protein
MLPHVYSCYNMQIAEKAEKDIDSQDKNFNKGTIFLFV